ncbi:MAG: hypothetical protein ACOZF0_01220 [Thermodesulfobacteriota bacterium]
MDPKFRKRLEVIRKNGKKAQIAAQKVDEIIERLCHQGVMFDEVGTVTKYGEQRLKNCVKYDLGNGYRLITVKHNREIFVLYVGTHDECHRWVENNRELRLELVRPRCEVIGVERPADPPVGEVEIGDECDAEDDLTQRIENLSDRELRMIFCGLAGCDNNVAS